MHPLDFPKKKPNRRQTALAKLAILDAGYGAGIFRMTNDNLVDWSFTLLYHQSMARPRSEEKRNAIIDAATRVIVAQGLSAPIAAIAQEAGVSNGLLFVYFQPALSRSEN
jgi:Bacterial regulatory proteins, tetR family